MFATDDVVYLMRKSGIVLMYAAVLTEASRTPRYLRSQVLADITRHER